MNMAVDEPGKQGLIPAIDGLGIGRQLPRRAAQYLFNPFPFQHHRPIDDWVPSRSIYDYRVFENQDAHPPLLSSFRSFFPKD
jgi:hypothetical protein